jgi:FtsZ-binding cell division protein ZapB
MDVFLDKLENVLDKFYQSKSNIDFLNLEFEEHKKKSEELLLKVRNLESDVDRLKSKSSNTENLWTTSVDFIVKIVYMLIVAYILYLLGWEGALEISP